MYTLATFRLPLAAEFTPLQTVSRVMVWIAFAAWLLTMVGLLESGRRTLLAQRGSPAGLSGGAAVAGLQRRRRRTRGSGRGPS